MYKMSLPVFPEALVLRILSMDPLGLEIRSKMGELSKEIVAVWSKTDSFLFDVAAYMGETPDPDHYHSDRDYIDEDNWRGGWELRDVKERLCDEDGGRTLVPTLAMERTYWEHYVLEDVPWDIDWSLYDTTSYHNLLQLSAWERDLSRRVGYWTVHVASMSLDLLPLLVEFINLLRRLIANAWSVDKVVWTLRGRLRSPSSSKRVLMRRVALKRACCGDDAVMSIRDGGFKRYKVV